MEAIIPPPPGHYKAALLCTAFRAGAEVRMCLRSLQFQHDINLSTSTKSGGMSPPTHRVIQAHAAVCIHLMQRQAQAALVVPMSSGTVVIIVASAICAIMPSCYHALDIGDWDSVEVS